MSYYHNHDWATETLASARSKSAGKPVQNNTRLFEREDGAIAVQSPRRRCRHHQQ